MSRVLIAVLAGISLLKFLLDLRNTARAAEVAGDFRSIMVASYNYYAEHDAWPAEGPAGGRLRAWRRPAGGVRVSPSRSTPSNENLGLGGGGFVIGVTVTSPNADLMTRLIRNLGNKHPYFAAGGTLTYIISQNGRG